MAGNTESFDVPTFIQDAYARLEQAVPGFVPRPEQRQLSLAIAERFVADTPLAAEAPTGTGKTLAYLIGGLAAATKLRGPQGPKPLVVSTGTKALQGQLLTNDLPKLAQAGLIRSNTAVIAKGKNNFFCAQAASDMTAQRSMDLGDLPDYMVNNDEEEGPLLSAEDVEPLLEAFEEGRWDGDFDNYKGVLPKPLTRIQVSSDTCQGKKCPRYAQCPYYRMKARMANASVIIANHDLVMLDLLLVSKEQEPTLPVENYLCVFDEAHQLPDKALKVGSAEANLATLKMALDKMRFFKKSVMQSEDLNAVIEARDLKTSYFEVGSLASPLGDLIRALQSLRVDTDTNTRRFPRAAVPEKLVELIARVHEPIETLTVRLSTAISALQAFGQQDGKGSRKDLQEALRRGIELSRTLTEIVTGFAAFCDQLDVVKWVYVQENRISLHTSPLEGAAVLKPLLWDGDRAQAVLVSATLRDINGFARYAQKAGLPSKAETLALPYSFPYQDSTLTVAHMQASPKPAERVRYVAELSEKVPRYLAQGEAALLLFPSRVLLQTVVPLLRKQLGQECFLVQGEKPIRQLLAQHVARVDAGETSVLCGLATMAEGLDLPGHYCEHVAIMALPFAVPSDPVEQEIAELLGNRYFAERSLPDAAVRLMQMVGRLLRRESDRGRITIFDHRLASTGYGVKMLRALPPFKKVVEKEALAA